MPELPIFFQEPALSCIGVMLFPDRLEAAESFTALRLAKGPLQDFRHIGGEVPPAVGDALLGALGRNALTEAEIDERSYWGSAVGEITKVLWALTCSHGDLASWEGAIKVVEAGAGKLTGSRSGFRRELSRFAPVLHLWGAWSIRNRGFHPAGPGPEKAMEELMAFFTEAELLLQGLREWLDTRDAKIRLQERYLSSEKFQPWSGWHPVVPERPEEGRGSIPHLELGAPQLSLLRKPGRPAKFCP